MCGTAAGRPHLAAANRFVLPSASEGGLNSMLQLLRTPAMRFLDIAVLRRSHVRGRLFEQV
jgi:hypothetical protein